MAEYQFATATRQQAKLRLAFAGPAGSGKTYSSLMLAGALGQRIALIDTERGSSQKYAGEAEIPAFDVLTLDRFNPESYIAAIQAATRGGYEVLILDSISHAWSGSGGILDIVDEVTAQSKSANAYTEGWRKASPLHNKFVDAMLRFPGHVIATVRSKTRYILQDNGRGQQVPKKVGMEWVTRDSAEYEFDIAGDLDLDNTLVITKTRCRALHGAVFAKPGAELAAIIVAWLNAGVPAAPDTNGSPADGNSARPQAAGAAHAVPQREAPAAAKPTPAKAAAKPAAKAAPAADESTRRQNLLLDIGRHLKRAVPGDDKGSVQERLDMMHDCFGVAHGWTELSKLPLDALQLGWPKLQAMTGESPPDDVPATVEAGEAIDDAQATATLIFDYAAKAAELGVTREWEDLFAGWRDDHTNEHGELIMDAEDRSALYAEVNAQLPALAEAMTPF